MFGVLALSVALLDQEPRIVGILHTKVLTGEEARELARERGSEEFHLRTVGGSAFLVSREIVPVEKNRRAVQFFKELGEKARGGRVVFDPSEFSGEARRALLSNFTMNRPDGVSLEAKGEVAMQMTSEVVLKSGEKEIQIPWRPGETMPARMIHLEPQPGDEVVRDSFALRFPFEPSRYVLHNLTPVSRGLRAENAKVWGDLFEAVAKEVDALHGEYNEAVSVCRSELIGKQGDPALKLEEGKLRPADLLALGSYLRANAKHLGFADEGEIDAFLAGATIKSQRYLLNLTVKDGPSGYVTSGVDMGAAAG